MVVGVAEESWLWAALEVLAPLVADGLPPDLAGVWPASLSRVEDAGLAAVVGSLLAASGLDVVVDPDTSISVVRISTAEMCVSDAMSHSG